MRILNNPPGPGWPRLSQSGPLRIAHAALWLNGPPPLKWLGEWKRVYFLHPTEAVRVLGDCIASGMWVGPRGPGTGGKA